MNRDSILAKIRALLSKTVENGCSEPEALAALAKARAMMDAYEVTEADLQLTKEQAAVVRDYGLSHDKHGIRSYLAVSVAAFCDCEVWRSGGTKGKLVFCGLPSDADLATWLLDTLTLFVQGELANHLMGCIAERGQRRFIINGFVAGCTTRISQRLKELIAQSKQAATSNGTALVVIKSAAVTSKMDALGINLRKGRRSSRRSDAAAYAAGRAAGDRASFNRPVGGSTAALIRG